LAPVAENLAERNAAGTVKRGVVRLSPWQERWRRDPARVKVVNAHRQSGKDFFAAAEAVDDAFRTHQPWYIVSMTQRQADATFAKARQIADAFKRVLKRRGEITLSESEYSEYDAEIDQHFRQVARTLHLPGGGSVTALPGRDPDTLAGLSGNVIFTEFGLFKPKGGSEHWRVVFPLITRGYRIIVITTPRGKNTKFYELCSQPETYSIHTQTLPDSIAEGFILFDNEGRPTDLETFKALYGDEAGFRREYLCEFTGDLESLIRWALLVEAAASPVLARPDALPFKCLWVKNGGGWQPAFFDDCLRAKGRLEIGWDVARHANFSVFWVNQSLPAWQGVRHLARLVVMQECEFELQRAVAAAAMAAPASVGCGDETGLGMDSNETLHKRFGDRWQPVTFTQAAKREAASLLRTAFGDRTQTLPPMQGDGAEKFIHTDLYALQKAGDGEKLTLEEGENPLLADSHCDIARACGLARKAAGIAAAVFKAWTA